MSDSTRFRLIGTDDDNALYQCAFCGNIIPIELDEEGNIDISWVDETCPECGAYIVDIEWD